MAKNRKKPSLLQFWGEQTNPDLPEQVLNHRNVLGNGKIPKELEHMRRNQVIYLDKNGDEDIKLEETGHDNKLKIVLPSFSRTNLGSYSLDGKTALKEEPLKFLKGTAINQSYQSYRPHWCDACYSPYVLPHNTRQKLRRINGSIVNPLYVFGSDDRVVFRSAAWPWGLVGKVFTSAGWVGSGALIGGRVMVTAGHVVPPDAWNGNSWWMRFVPAYYNGTSLHGIGVESYVSDVRGYNVNNVVGYDWAVCRLYNPLGSHLGYFGYNGYSSSWNHQPYWSVIGYPGAVASGRRPSFQGGNTVFDTDGDSNGGLEIETTADITGGNSGGPMFGWWNGDPRIIGVVSGEEEDWNPGVWPWQWGRLKKGNVIAGGSGFTNLVAWARSNWG